MRYRDERAKNGCVLGFSVIFLMLLGSEARAELYDFQAISNNSGVAGGLAAGLTVEVVPYGDGSNQALFKFASGISDPYEGNIMRMFFDDRNGLGAISGLIEPPEFGVHFQYGNHGGGNFPEGNNLARPFVTTGWAGFKGGSGKVGPGEYLGVIYDLADGVDFQDLMNAIGDGTSGSLRVGVHVGSIAPMSGVSDSDSFVMVCVPAPAAALLGAWGIGAAGLCLRRRRDLANA